MRKTLAATAMALMAVSSHGQQPAASFNSTANVMIGSDLMVSTYGEHQTAGHCVSHYALIAAHADLRAKGARVEAACESVSPAPAFTVVCDGSRNAAASDRLFAAGTTLYIDKKDVTVAAEDVQAICTSSRTVAPATRLQVQ